MRSRQHSKCENSKEILEKKREKERKNEHSKEPSEFSQSSNIVAQRVTYIRDELDNKGRGLIEITRDRKIISSFRHIASSKL